MIINNVTKVVEKEEDRRKELTNNKEAGLPFHTKLKKIKGLIV